MNAAQIAAAVAAITPIVRALVLEAEQTNASGEEKHAAVADGTERIYRMLQGTGGIREIKDVPWEIVGPIVVPVAGGLISALVGLFNRLWGKVWSLVSGDD